MAYVFPLTPDQVAQFRGEITTYAGMRATPTVQLQQPVVYEISINDDSEFWKLRPRAVGENDDGTSLLLPGDYNASTNPVIWIKIG